MTLFSYADCSSSSHTWDAFQLAHASFRLYCIRNNLVLPANSQKSNDNLGPHLLGEPPKINVTPPELAAGDDEEGSPDAAAVNIYDDDVSMKFLVCGVACSLVSSVSLLFDYFPVYIHRSLHQAMCSFHLSIIVCLWANLFSGCFLIGFFGRWPQCALEY